MMRKLILLPMLASALGAGETVPTFYKDVLPILQKNCQVCHRPGEAAPMSLLTYKEARPWAAAIREAVLSKKMPPWGADSSVGKFSNDRSLSEKDIRTVAAWGAARAPEGNPKDAAAPPAFVEGWNIGKPDLVVAMPEAYRIPAHGTVEYTYFVVPSGFTEDKWVKAVEIRPDNRALVHHIIVFVREPGSKWLQDAKPHEAFVPPLRKDEKTGQENRDAGEQGQFLVGYAPGVPAEKLEAGQGKLIQAGSDLVFQVHYTTNGQAGRDQSKVGLVFASETPKERVLTVGAANGDFAIPPGNAEYPVSSKLTFYGDATIRSYGPHMHMRGKSFRYELVKPDGTREALLNVPKYDFNWQHWYAPVTPLKVTAGTTIECFATYDNSVNNRFNPDPNREVRWGDQTWDEMMIGFMDVAFDARKTPGDIFSEPKPPTQSAALSSEK